MSAPADVARIAEPIRGLTKVRREWLERICRTNGGGVRISCRVNEDGYGRPVSKPVTWLLDAGLIQGKAGGYETVVHTRQGLALYRAHLLAEVRS